MAFVFVVETGTGLSNATSYLTVAEANAFISTNILAYPAWDALTTGAKEAVLIQASRFLDNRTRWRGQKTVAASGLRWPRVGVSDRDGITIDDDVVPEEVKQATAELARFLAFNDLGSFRSQDGLKQVTADVVTLIFNENYRLPKVPSEIQHIIFGLGSITGNRGFGKIKRT